MKKEAIEYSRLVRMFCTPPPYPLSEVEMNALKKADTFTVRFEDWDLPCYSWGEGKTVLLCHGWGSRAGHLVLMAMVLARVGYKVVSFDVPACGIKFQITNTNFQINSKFQIPMTKTKRNSMDAVYLTLPPRLSGEGVRG